MQLINRNLLKILVVIFFSFFLIGCGGKKTKDVVKSNILDSLKKLDTPLRTAQPGDWLYANKEPGQTFDQYTAYSPIQLTEKQNIFYIQPIGDFTAYQEKILKDLIEYLDIFFTLQVKIMPTIPDSIFSGDEVRWSSTGNHQILTHFILYSILKKNLPTDAMMVMGITNRDLYTGHDNNYVFGQATLKGRIGVASMWRFLEQEADSTQCLERIIKTASHETGHMLGIWHCTYAVCMMNGSNSLEELDNRPCSPCSECMKKIQWNLQFSIGDRYEKLEAFYVKNGFLKEQKFIQKSQQVLHLK